jgi:hypothetical protein
MHLRKVDLAEANLCYYGLDLGRHTALFVREIGVVFGLLVFGPAARTVVPDLGRRKPALTAVGELADHQRDTFLQHYIQININRNIEIIRQILSKNS